MAEDDRPAGPGWAADPARTRSKRSQTVSLILLAGAGATAFGLGSLDPTQREEDVLVYADPEACISAHIRAEGDCLSEYYTARAAYPKAAPRYSSLADCEGHHGAGHCVPGEQVTADAQGRYMPRMAAYLVGRSLAQALDPQPVFEHAPQSVSSAYSGGHGGYCTGWGGRVTTSSGGRASTARVASAAVRTASFGGFGSTGRGFSSGGSHASHGSLGGGG